MGLDQNLDGRVCHTLDTKEPGCWATAVTRKIIQMKDYKTL